MKKRMLGFACCVALSAQSPQPLKTSITVTATRTEDEIKYSPISSNVIDSKELEQRALRSVDQALTLTPGLYVQRGKGDSDQTTKVQLRGFNGSGKSLVLLDGQPIQDAYTGEVNWSALPIDEIERVEVARGPFSSLYGGNALGGVIQFKTRPVSRRELAIRAQRGSYATTDTSIRYADRWKNRLGISLGYRRLQHGGYANRFGTAAPVTTAGAVIPVTGAIPSQTSAGALTFLTGASGETWYNQHSWRGRLEYAFSESTIASFQYIRQDYGYGYDDYRSYLRDAAGNTIDRGLVLFDNRRLNITPSNFLQGPGFGHSHFFSTSVQHKFSARKLLRADASFYNQPNNSFSTHASTARRYDGDGSLSERTGRTWHGNLQYSWSPVTAHALTFGTETRQEMSYSADWSLANWTQAFTKLAPTANSVGRAFSQGTYVQDTWRVRERLTIVAGARYEYWKTYSGIDNAARYPERSTQSLTAKIAASYVLPGDVVARFSAGNAFRNPNVYELYRTTRIGTILYYPSAALNSEKVLSTEAGLRKQFARGLDLDAAYYANHITDLIYRRVDLAADPNGRIRVFGNAGEGRTRGVEFAAGQSITRWAKLRTTYTFTDALITRNAAAPQSEGKRVPQIPRHMASALLTASFGKFAGTVSSRYSSGIFATDTNTDRTRHVQGSYDPFALADATLSYRLNDRIELYGQAENLAARTYYLFYLSPGRTVTGGVRLRIF